MKALLFLLLIIECSAGVGQQVINVDNNDVRINYSASDILHGSPIGNAKYVRVTSGSPYFSEAWMIANIYITDATVAGRVRVKLNLLDGSFVYLDKNNEEMVSYQPVLKLTLIDTLASNKYVFIHLPGTTKNPDKSWYQVIAGEKFILLKSYHKKIIESKTYASSLTEQEIRTTENYFIRYNNEMTMVKKFSDIIALAGSKSSKLQEYINSNKLSMKKEADLVSLVNHYNTLN